MLPELAELDELAGSFLFDEPDDESLFEDESEDFESELDDSLLPESLLPESLPLLFEPDFDDRLSVL